MKTIDPDLLAHYQQEVTTVATFLKVTRTDGEIFGFTTTNQTVTIDEVEYEPGFDVSALSSAEGLAVDNLELTILPDLDGGTVTRLDLLTGKWNGAFFQIFNANYLDPAGAIENLKFGYTGEVRLDNSAYVIEFRSLAQLLQAQQGIVTAKNCRARLGDDLCGVDLGPFTETGSLTGVTSNQVVTDSARTEDDDWYGDGTFECTSGDNAGYTRRIKTFAAGVFTFDIAFDFPFLVGDDYVAIAGCRKRHERTLENPDGISDCFDKFDNVLNFQGEPNLPGLDAISATDTATE